MGWLDKIFGRRHLYKAFFVNGKAIAKANANVIEGKKGAEKFFSELIYSSWYFHFPELIELANYLAGTDQRNIARDQFDEPTEQKKFAAKLLRALGTTLEKAFYSGQAYVPRVKSNNQVYGTEEFFHQLAADVESGNDTQAYQRFLNAQHASKNRPLTDGISDPIPGQTLNIIKTLLEPNLPETQRVKKLREHFDKLSDDVHSQTGRELAGNSIVVLQGEKAIKISLTKEVNFQYRYQQVRKFIEKTFPSLTQQEVQTILNFSSQAVGFGLFTNALTHQLSDTIMSAVTDKEIEERKRINDEKGKIDVRGNTASAKEKKRINDAFENPSNPLLKYYLVDNDRTAATIIAAAPIVDTQIVVVLDENQRLKEIRTAGIIRLINQAKIITNPEDFFDTVGKYSLVYQAPSENIPSNSAIAELPGNQGLGNILFKYEALNDAGNLLLNRNVSLLGAKFANPIKQYLYDNYKLLLAGGAAGAVVLIATPFLWPAYLAFAIGFVAVEIVLTLSPVIGSILGVVVVDPAKRAINWFKARFSSSSKQELELTAETEPLIQKAGPLPEPASTGKMFQTTAIPQLVQAIALIYMVGLKHSWEEWEKYRESLQNQTFAGLKKDLRAILSQIQDPQILLNVYQHIKTGNKYPNKQAFEYAQEQRKINGGGAIREEDKFSNEDIDAFSKHIYEALTETKSGAAVILHATELAKAFFAEGPQSELIAIITAVAQQYADTPEMQQYLPTKVADKKQKRKADEVTAPAALASKSIKELQEIFANQLAFISGAIDSEVEKAKQIAKVEEATINSRAANGFITPDEAARQKATTQAKVQSCQPDQEVIHAYKLKSAFETIGGWGNSDVARHVKLATDNSSAQANIVAFILADDLEDKLANLIGEGRAASNTYLPTDTHEEKAAEDSSSVISESSDHRSISAVT